MINDKEKEIAQECIRWALKAGATDVRISLDKSVLDSYSLLDGQLDKVTHSADNGITAYIYVGGSFGCFATNKMDSSSIKEFINNAVARTSLLEEDECRNMPERERQCKNALTGLETGLFDNAYFSIDGQSRKLAAEKEYSSGEEVFKTLADEADLKAERRFCEIKSVETEYSDSVEDHYIIDSQGFEGRHSETGFSCYSQITVIDGKGERYSDSWYESRSSLGKLECGKASGMARLLACSKISARKQKGGKYTMVLGPSAASTFVSPIITALYGGLVHQGLSFLAGHLGEQRFPQALNIVDFPLEKGRLGARLFDSEGVATSELPLIENGRVRNYLISTYNSGKLSLPPTVDDVFRPTLLQFGENMLTLRDILRSCDKGILVTGINGGNCNSLTGDFSYGVEGYSFERGVIVSPIRGMVVTGNIISLWEKAIAAGNDARTSYRWQIPSLAFEDVIFSA